jgi:acetyltransferase-like isoleucine patch superfamily enzyme
MSQALARARTRARRLLVPIYPVVLRWVWGMDIGEGCVISLKAKLDFTNPYRLHIGDGTYLAFDSVIFTHDMSRALHADTHVGRNCFIGARAVIMPGVTVGDHCIVEAASVVTEHVPRGSIVAGNPAMIIRSNIRTKKFGVLEQGAGETSLHSRVVSFDAARLRAKRGHAIREPDPADQMAGR